MFGEFEKGQRDVLFDVSFGFFSFFIKRKTFFHSPPQDDAVGFVAEASGMDAAEYKKLRCLA